MALQTSIRQGMGNLSRLTCNRNNSLALTFSNEKRHSKVILRIVLLKIGKARDLDLKRTIVIEDMAFLKENNLLVLVFLMCSNSQSTNDAKQYDLTVGLW